MAAQLGVDAGAFGPAYREHYEAVRAILWAKGATASGRRSDAPRSPETSPATPDRETVGQSVCPSSTLRVSLLDRLEVALGSGTRRWCTLPRAAACAPGTAGR